MGKGDALFATGAGAESCTQEVKAERVMLKGLEGREFPVKMVDTMGFPDPDPEKGQQYYDSVIKAVSQPMNAVIFMVKLERTMPVLVEQYKLMFREFNNLQCSSILLVNSYESHGSDDDEDDKKKKNQKVEVDAQKFARSFSEATGLEFTKVIISRTKSDLGKRVPIELCTAISGTMPKASKLKTLAELREEVEQATTKEQQAKLELEKEQEAVDKARRNLAEKKELLDEWSRCQSVADWCKSIPFVGGVAKMVDDIFFKQQIKDLEAEIRSIEVNVGTMADQVAKGPNRLEELAAMAAEKVANFMKLVAAFGGQS